MIHQNLKDVYYLLLFPSSKLLRPIYREHFRIFRAGKDRAHIGSGQNYLPGFVNIDSNFQRRCDYLLDVRAGLPFPDSSLAFLYSCHMLEHLHITESIALLRECCRVLKDGGYMRLTLPDFRFVLQILAGEESCVFPRSFSSLEGQAINHLFCDGQHKYGYSREVLAEIALPLGFSKVVSANRDDENVPNLAEIEPGGSFSVNLYK